MKNSVLLSLFLFSSISIFGQVTFQKGYFIDSKLRKTECLIRNNDWSQSPQKFKYKLAPNAITRERSVKNTNVFEIYGASKYIRHQVDISWTKGENNSGQNVTEEGQEEKFLRVLLEGEVSLYEYSKRQKTFFYRDKAGIILPLIYERATISDDNGVDKKGYLSQITQSIRCDDTPIQTILDLAYTRADLENYFKTYHECLGVEYTTPGFKNRQNPFKISAQFAVYSAHADATRTRDGRELQFTDEVGYRIGFEVEAILPLKSRKWSVFITPSYLTYSSTAKLAIGNANFDSSVEYKSIDVPVGIRYSSYFNEKSKLFVNVMFVFGFTTQSEILLSPMVGYELNATPSFAAGLGYEFNEKVSAEIRFNSPRNLLSEASNWEARYYNSGLIFGYIF